LNIKKKLDTLTIGQRVASLQEIDYGDNSKENMGFYINTSLKPHENRAVE